MILNKFISALTLKPLRLYDWTYTTVIDYNHSELSDGK